MRNDGMTAGTLLLGACVLLSAGCKRTGGDSAPATQPATANTSQSAPARVDSNYVNRPPEPVEIGPMSLLALRPFADRCEWSVLEPPEFTSRQVMVTYACPPMPWSLAWDEGTARSFFALEGQLYLHDWKAARVDAFGAAPTPNPQPEVGISPDGTPHVCQELQRPKPQTDGPEYTYLVKLQRDAASGAWREAAADLIDYESNTPPLCSGGDVSWAPGGVRYEPQKQSANNCTPNLAQRAANELCPSPAISDSIRKQVQQPNDGIEHLLMSTERGTDRFLAYAITQHDIGVSPLAPLFYIDKERASVIYDRQRFAELLIAQAGDYFLVRQEGSINRATLFKKGDQQPKALIEFPDETVVMWIPGRLAVAEVIQIARPDIASSSNAATADEPAHGQE